MSSFKEQLKRRCAFAINAQDKGSASTNAGAVKQANKPLNRSQKTHHNGSRVTVTNDDQTSARRSDDHASPSVKGRANNHSSMPSTPSSGKAAHRAHPVADTAKRHRAASPSALSVPKKQRVETGSSKESHKHARPVQTSPLGRSSSPSHRKQQRLEPISASSQKRPRPSNQSDTKQSAVKKPRTDPPSATVAEVSAVSDPKDAMRQKLVGAKFRWMNELLYTQSGTDAWDLFQQDPELYDQVLNLCRIFRSLFAL